MLTTDDQISFNAAFTNEPFHKGHRITTVVEYLLSSNLHVFKSCNQPKGWLFPIRENCPFWSLQDRPSICTSSLLEASTLVLAAGRCATIVAQWKSFFDNVWLSNQLFTSRFTKDVSSAPDWDGWKWVLMEPKVSRKTSARPLPDGSVDVVCCDLPFGRQFGSVESGRQLTIQKKPDVKLADGDHCFFMWWSYIVFECVHVWSPKFYIFRTKTDYPVMNTDVHMPRPWDSEEEGENRKQLLDLVDNESQMIKHVLGDAFVVNGLSCLFIVKITTSIGSRPLHRKKIASCILKHWQNFGGWLEPQAVSWWRNIRWRKLAQHIGSSICPPKLTG